MNNTKAELISEIEKNQRILNTMNDLENTIKEKDNYIESIKNDLNRLEVYDKEYWKNIVKCDCRSHNSKCTNFDHFLVKCRQCNWTWYFIKN